MAISKKSFVNLDLQGNALVNPTIGLNSNMTKAGSFQYNDAEFRLEYFNGTLVEQVANLTDISAVTGGLIFQGGYDPTTNTPDITVDNDSVKKGFFWVATAAGTFLGETVQVGDSIIAKQDNPAATAANWLILQGNVVIATDTVDGIVRLATQTEVNTGTEGGAVVLTPATFAASQQLADINTDITNLENDKLSKTGGTMSGNIDMGMNEVNNLNAVRTDEVSNHAGDIGFTWDGGNLNLNGISKITGLTDAPTLGTDAANKTYVDGAAATAETDANDYTDTQIAAQSYFGFIDVATGWTPVSDFYIATITHNLDFSNLNVTCWDNSSNSIVEFYVKNYGPNQIQLVSNVLPSDNVNVAISKVSPYVA